MLVLKFSNLVDGIESGILGQGLGHDLHSLGELGDRQLLTALQSGCVFPEAHSQLDLRCSTARHQLIVLNNIGDGMQCIIQSSLQTVQDLLRAAPEKQGYGRILGAGDKGHDAVSNPLLFHQSG